MDRVNALKCHYLNLIFLRTIETMYNRYFVTPENRIVVLQKMTRGRRAKGEGGRDGVKVSRGGAGGRRDTEAWRDNHLPSPSSLDWSDLRGVIFTD